MIRKRGKKQILWGGHDNVLSFILPITGSICGVKQISDTIYGCLIQFMEVIQFMEIATATVAISWGREYRSTKIEVRKLFLYPGMKE